MTKLDKYEKIGVVLGFIIGVLLNLYFTVGIIALIVLPILGIISWWWLVTVIPMAYITYKLYNKES